MVDKDGPAEVGLAFSNDGSGGGGAFMIGFHCLGPKKCGFGGPSNSAQTVVPMGSLLLFLDVKRKIRVTTI